MRTQLERDQLNKKKRRRAAYVTPRPFSHTPIEYSDTQMCKSDIFTYRIWDSGRQLCIVCRINVDIVVRIHSQSLGKSRTLNNSSKRQFSSRKTKKSPSLGHLHNFRNNSLFEMEFFQLY